MKIVVPLFILAIFWIEAEALMCWTCLNTRSVSECNRLGKLQHCRDNENACFNEVRRSHDETQITKRCKQRLACRNNKIQNIKSAWYPTQCNRYIYKSVCRCCCFSSGCNIVGTRCDDRVAADELRCAPLGRPRFGRMRCNFRKNKNDVGSVCTFRCNLGYDLLGSKESSCVSIDRNRRPRFNFPVPRCMLKTCPALRTPRHGTANCTNGVTPGSICRFECDDFFHNLRGNEEIQCGNDGKWNGFPAACVAVSCPALKPLENGFINCSHGFDEDSICTFSCITTHKVVGAEDTICVHLVNEGIWSYPVPVCERKRCSKQLTTHPRNGRVDCSDSVFLFSECTIACDLNYRIAGSMTVTCEEDKDGLVDWSSRQPTCERIVCPNQNLLRNERVKCTNGNFLGSVCTFECTSENYELDPKVTSNVCLENSTWNIPKPCCSRICPPHTVLDLVIMIDSSSSIGVENWASTKAFVRQIINTFQIGPDAARLGVFRYNRVVDESSQILLRDYPNNKTALLLAFNRIPYNGQGTYTGNALRHVKNVMFSRRNGNRLNAPDFLLIITDGRSFDSVRKPADDLHKDGVHINVIGVQPTRGRLDLRQLNQIISHREDLTIARGGFSDLNSNIYAELDDLICIPGCL